MSARVLRRSASVAAVLALVAGPVLLSSPAAYAATTPDPAITGDTNAGNGTVAFYDSTGTRVYGGSSLSHLFDYALGSADAPRTGTTKATLFFGFPDHTKPDSTTWFESQQSASTNFPNAAAPAPLNATGRKPLVTLTSGDGNLQGLLSTTTQDTTSGYAGILQVRVYDSGAGAGNGKTAPFWASDIYYDGTAGTWQQVFPAPPAASTNALTANPSPATVGQTVTIKSTIAPAAAAGSVQFFDGSTSLGTQAVSGGVAQITTSSLAVGSHALKSVFTPADPSAYQSSTGTVTEVVNANPTTTGLAVSGNTGTDGNDVKYTATVSPAVPGSVVFKDNGATVPGAVTNPTAGSYVLDLPTGPGAGNHSVVATFTPADTTNYGASSSAAQAFYTNPQPQGACSDPASVCSEDQNVQATIPVGTLVINTPYTSTSPLDLGTLALDPTGSFFTGSAPFQNIKVTDARSGALPWTVTALASDLSDGGANAYSKINAQNVGLVITSFAKTSGFVGTVLTTDNPAASGVAPGASGSLGLGGSPHTVASTDHGTGVLTLQGTLTIKAPVATEAGVFKGVITFTVG